MMFDSVRSAIDTLRAVVASLEPASVRGEDAARLVELFAEAERLSAAGRTLAIRRVEETKVWQREGHRTAATWMASKTGMFVGHAIESLETARRLDELPATKEAFCAGRLSEMQTREIASAAAADPAAEAQLLRVASKTTVAGLRAECRRVKAAAISDEVSAHEAIRRGRYLRHWSDQDGAVRLDARLTPDAGAAVIAALDARKERILSEARRAGLRESYDAYAADALLELATATGRNGARGPRAMVHVVVDHAALKRGHTEAGERCEIPGVGPIAVSTARALGADAIWKAILTDGVDIKAVAHLGRNVSSHVRTALEVRDSECVVPGCDVRKHLEIDHWKVPFACGGPTAIENLARMCRWHHYQKTHLGFRLAGGPGAWEWLSPVNQERERPPPPGDP